MAASVLHGMAPGEAVAILALGDADMHTHAPGTGALLHAWSKLRHSVAAGGVRFVRIHVDANPDACVELGIMATPWLIVGRVAPGPDVRPTLSRGVSAATLHDALSDGVESMRGGGAAAARPRSALLSPGPSSEDDEGSSSGAEGSGSGSRSSADGGGGHRW